MVEYLVEVKEHHGLLTFGRVIEVVVGGYKLKKRMVLVKILIFD